MRSGPSERGGYPITTTQAKPELNEHSLDWLVSHLRWVWLFLLVLIVLLSARSSPAFLPAIALVGIGFVVNMLIAGLLWAGLFPGWLSVMVSLFDAVIGALLLFVLGAWAVLLFPLMVFPVLLAGMRWGPEVGLLMILPLLAARVIPLLPELRQAGFELRPDNLLLGLGMPLLALLAAAILPGIFIGGRVALAEKNNAAELERLRVANERAKLISEMAQTMSSTLNYRKVLRTVVDLAFAAMAEVGTRDDSTIAMILLFAEDGEGGRLTVAAGRNIARTDEGRKVPSEIGLIGRTIRKAEVSISHNAAQDKAMGAFASTRNIQSAICAPLRAGLSTYGVFLFCSTEPNAYTEEHKALLQTFCSQAIIPLQNAQLFDDLRREQAKILEKEAEARRKLARDLHDGPTQSVAAIVMRLSFIKMVVKNGEYDKVYDELDKVEDIAQRTTQEIRTMLFAMRPVILETQGLVPALEQYAERLNKNEPFQIHFSSYGYDGQLSHDAEGVVFAIIEEAVGNAKKHAQASNLWITLQAGKDSLTTEVKDDGVGFDVVATQSTYDQRTSLGLINMDERAQIVGGSCTLESARGRGTTVRVEIPFMQTPVEEEI